MDFDPSAQTGTLTLESTQFSGAPVTRLTLGEVIKRARANAAQFSAATTDAKIAHEDRVQARAALLPNVSYSTGKQWRRARHQAINRILAGRSPTQYACVFLPRTAQSCEMTWRLRSVQLRDDGRTGVLLRSVAARQTTARSRRVPLPRNAAAVYDTRVWRVGLISKYPSTSMSLALLFAVFCIFEQG